MILFMAIALMVISISAAESVSWSFTIAHHARWLKKHSDYERRVAASSTVLLYTAILSCAFSLIAWAWFIHVMALIFLNVMPFSYKPIICFTVIFGVQLISISMWSVISQFICLPGIFWPLLSKLRAKVGMAPVCPSSSDSYIKSLREWKKIYLSGREGKSLIVNFLNNLPVVVWTKSINRKYTFMSGYFYARFGLDPYTSVVGKTGQEVADLIKKHDPSFTGTTFNEDEKRLFEEKIQLTAFVELTVQNKPVSFQVVNVPMYRGDKLIGLIGIARETTWEIEQMTKIHELFKNNRVSEGVLEFEKYLHEVREYKYIQKGMSVLKGENSNV